MVRRQPGLFKDRSPHTPEDFVHRENLLTQGEERSLVRFLKNLPFRELNTKVSWANAGTTSIPAVEDLRYSITLGKQKTERSGRMTSAESLAIAFGSTRVSGLLLCPARASACYVLAHGAGAGMTHPFMEAIAGSLAEKQVATLRFQFPYMEFGAKRPDPPKVAQAAVRAAVFVARERLPNLPLIAGGKSFGGRMTSQAQAAEPLPGVRGLVFLGFPLHPANQPSSSRAEHLDDVTIPMLFLQGTRDALASIDLVHALMARLGGRATLHIIEGADHSFRLPARSGRKGPEVISELAAKIADWTRALISAPP